MDNCLELNEEQRLDFDTLLCEEFMSWNSGNDSEQIALEEHCEKELDGYSNEPDELYELDEITDLEAQELVHWTAELSGEDSCVDSLDEDAEPLTEAVTAY